MVLAAILQVTAMMARFISSDFVASAIAPAFVPATEVAAEGRLHRHKVRLRGLTLQSAKADFLAEGFSAATLVAGMRQRFNFWIAALRVLVVSLLCASSLRAQTVSDLPLQSQQKLYNWLASTDKTRQNKDYFLLKPRETRRISLPSGDLLRLWFTSSAPEKCGVTLQNGAQKIVLLQNSKAPVGELFAKAWTLYPQSTLR